MTRHAISPELRAELPLLYRHWLAAKRKKKRSKFRRARARWLDALAGVVERHRERRAPVLPLMAAATAIASVLHARRRRDGLPR